MVRDLTTDLERQLEDCALALQSQAQAMLATLAEFESQVKARLDAAEARMATIREYAPAISPNSALRRPIIDE
ncbi:MAG TPA: hypothetical protein VKT80_03250 [Chloroflexota bacterium]|nr:hypothetical protein [Chloroflexota bacterium]